METQLKDLVTSERLDADDIAARTRRIHDAVLRESEYLDRANFTRIHTSDLRRLFHHYDNDFFGRQIGALLGEAPLRFGVSRRATSAGGKTIRYTPRGPHGQPNYEISVSTTLIFQCFAGEDHRPISVGGLVCCDRLESVQRVMEHELVHLIELLLWSSSSCSRQRFQSIANRFFGHTVHKHGLITPRERALVTFGIKTGDRVRFRFNGSQHTGIVNRITNRATVLVEDPGGRLFTNGKRYVTFYVPVDQLESSVGTPATRTSD